MTKLNSKQEAKSPETSPSRLLALAQEGADLACVVAANEACPPDLLRSLAEHKDAKVRQRVVANPQTPAEVAAKLGSQFPEHLLDNPAFDIYLLERPDLLEGIGASALRSLVKRNSCPVGFLEYAAGFDDKATQLSVLTNAATPCNAVERLLQSAHPPVKEAAQWHLCLQGKLPKNWRGILTASIAKSLSVEQPNEALNALAYVVASTLSLQGYTWAEKRDEGDILHFRTPGVGIWSVAMNSSAPAALLEQLAGDLDEGVRQGVAQNPSTPTSVLEHLAKDKNSDVRSCVAHNPTTPRSVLEHLARDKNSAVRSLVAQNPTTPTSVRASILEHLAKDRKSEVRSWVARNPFTPLSLLEHLAEDSSEFVRRDVADNLSTPAAVLESLAEDPEDYVRSGVVENPSIPPSLLERWFYEKSEILHQKIASLRSSPETSVNRWDRYADELTVGDAELFLADIARNPSTPVSTLERLTGIKRKKNIQYGLAQNPSTPVLVLESLAVEKSVGVREGVARNPSTPVSVLERLAEDSDKDILTGVAGNPHTPLYLLERLALDNRDDVRRRVAENASTPSSVLGRLALDEYASVRKCAAENIATPVSMLERLAEDTDKDTRTAAAGNPSLPGSVMQRLFLISTDASSEIMKRVSLSVVGSDPLADLMAMRSGLLEKLTSVTSPSAFRLLGLRLPDCPAATLAKAQRSADWRERCAIASNPNSPLSVVQRLAEDGNVLVKAAALERLNAREP